MHATAPRYVVVNADDFGQSPGVNRGIIEGHERGIVTSASVMVRWPDVEEAAAYGRSHPKFGLGLHLDLGEWICREGSWVPLYEVVCLTDATAVADEVSRQLVLFISLIGRPPTHIDSHQHVHLHEPVRSVVVEAGRTLNIPVRRIGAGVNYCGGFYGQDDDGAPLPQAISVNRLLALLTQLPPGITELSCHPGLGDDLKTMYRSERAEELKALCDPRLRAAIAHMHIELRSFRDINVRRTGDWIKPSRTVEQFDVKAAP